LNVNIDKLVIIAPLVATRKLNRWTQIEHS